jgi:hypothetical protein
MGRDDRGEEGRSKLFSAENGVEVYVSGREKRGLEPL